MQHQSSHQQCTKTLTNAVVKLSCENSNAFLILGRVKHAILQSDRPDLADIFFTEAVSGDYDNLLRTCMRYVSVE